MTQRDWRSEGGGGKNDRSSGARGPRYAYPQRPSGEGTQGPPSGQFEAWSPVLTASEVLAKRWKTVIMWLLGRDRRRFNELQSHMPGVTPKVLTEQLRELERDGLVERSVIRGGAKHVEYALTALGESLRPIVEQLQHWGREYLASRDEWHARVDAPGSEQRKTAPEIRTIQVVEREHARGVVPRADSHPASHGRRGLAHGEQPPGGADTPGSR